MLNEGLLPVYREASSEEWNRVNQKIDTSKIVRNILDRFGMKAGLNGCLDIPLGRRKHTSLLSFIHGPILITRDF